MRRVMTSAMTALLAMALTVPVLAGEAEAKKEEVVTKTYKVWVASGEAMAFRAAMKAHLDMFHRKTNNPQPMTAYQVVNGRDLGAFIFRETVHGWAGFDNMKEAEGDGKDFATNVLPHIKHASSHLGVWQDKLSRWPDDLMHPKLVEVTVFSVTYSGYRDFLYAIKKLNKVIGKKAPDWKYGWEVVVNGTRGYKMVLAIPHDNWADFAPQEPSLWKMVEDVYGEHEVQMLRKLIGDSVAHQESFVVEYQPDLSYVPEKK